MEDRRSDGELLTASATEPGAFTELYRRHAQDLLRYFARRTLDPEAAAELTAETFAQAFASRTTYRDTGANGVAWIYGVARQQLGRFFRSGRVDRGARRRLGMPERELPPADFERVEDGRLVRPPPPSHRLTSSHRLPSVVDRSSIEGMEHERRHERAITVPARIDLRDEAWLRLLVPDDAEVVFDVVHRNRRRLRRWLPFVDGTIVPADTRAFIEGTIASEGREYAYGIWTGDGLAGCIGLHTDPERRSAMIGYWIDADHEGRGLVTEASRALTETAFRDLAIHRVWLSADPRNTRSCAVAERLGFRLEGVHREDTIVDGRFRDTVIYAILEDEWPPSGRS